MASIHREIRVGAAADAVWQIVRDVGAIHQRLVPGFVTDCRLEEGGKVRVVTFANGMVVRELILDVDDTRRRVAWSARSGQLSHHNASLQVLSDGSGSRLVWVADLLPDTLAPAIAAMIDEGMAAMQMALQQNQGTPAE